MVHIKIKSLGAETFQIHIIQSNKFIHFVNIIEKVGLCHDLFYLFIKFQIKIDIPFEVFALNNGYQQG